MCVHVLQACVRSKYDFIEIDRDTDRDGDGDGDRDRDRDRDGNKGRKSQRDIHMTIAKKEELNQ